eukprot:6823502-Pyramimonas_sp.AAC.1
MRARHRRSLPEWLTAHGGAACVTEMNIPGAAGAVLRDVHFSLAATQIREERADHGGAVLAAERHLART